MVLNEIDSHSKNETQGITIGHSKKRRILRYSALGAVLVGTLFVLYLLSQYNYLLFHSLAELFSIIIALDIFIIIWNSRKIIDNHFFVFLGISLLFVGVLILFHTLGYKGKGVFPGVTTNLATQLWIASRYLLSISFLLSFLFIHRKVRSMIVFAGYAITTTLILASIFYWQVFPQAFVEGSGLTPFKIISEYVISFLLLIALVLLYRFRKEFNRTVVYYLGASIVITITSEMAFTLYTDPYGISNMIGHILEIIAFFCIYKALVEIGLTKPDELLFRNLKKSELSLTIQAAELTRLNDQLTKEIESRKTIETALRNQEERYHSTLDNMLEGCQIIGFDWKYLYMNDAAARHGQTTKEALLGHTMMESYPGIETTAMFKQLKSCMERRTSHLMENQFIYPNGTKGWFELSIQPVSEGVFILSQDITERKTNEEKTRQLNEQLITTNKELEAFSYSVSHDLRTPLRSIAGFSAIVFDDYAKQLDEQGKEYLTRIRQASDRMGQLIDDILRLSRINQTDLHLEHVDLSMLSQKVIEKFKQDEPSRKIKITIQKNLFCTCDKKLMEIVLENLLGNAWKFTRNTKHPKIEIGSTTEDNTTVFYVKDNGAGFDMAYAEKLFTPFQRLHSNDEFPGTGIGLAIVQRIIHKHGGAVQADGAVGKGATFTFSVGENNLTYS